jgi:DNA-directed RNA polymerase specialized sigma24 family protein
LDQAAEPAFAESFRARREAVRRIAPHRAEDLAQTAFVAPHRKWDSLHDPGAVDVYLRRILVRALIDESHRPWRRERSVSRTSEPVGSTTGSAEHVSTRLALLQVLGELPPRRRGLLVPQFLDVAATAKALSCRQGTVKSQTAHGLAAPRTVLGGGRAWTSAG